MIFTSMFHNAAKLAKPFAAPVKRKLTGMAELQRDRFETLLDHAPAQLNKPEVQDRKRYVASLQRTHIGEYQDYRQSKYANFLTEAGVKKGRLKTDLMHEMQVSDHVRNNYAYFRQQQNRLSGTPASLIASNPALAPEARVFRAFKGSLINTPRTRAVVPPAPPSTPVPSVAPSVRSNFIVSPPSSKANSIKAPSTVSSKPSRANSLKGPKTNPYKTPNRSTTQLSNEQLPKPIVPTKPIVSPQPSIKPNAFKTIKKSASTPAFSAHKKPSTPVLSPKPIVKKTPSISSLSEKSKPSELAPPPRPPKTPLTPPPLRKVASQSALSHETTLNFTQLPGPDLRTLKIIQNDGHSCYALALLDNIMQYPQRERDALLASIQLTKTAEGYLVKCETQAEATLVRHSDLDPRTNWRVATTEPADIRIPILQQAFLKLLPGDARYDIGESLKALNTMFPERLLPNVEPINWSPKHLAPEEYRDSVVSPEEYKAKLQKLIQDVKEDVTKLPLMTALRGGHIRSVRLLESTSEHVKLYDSNEGLVDKPIDDFIKEFSLIGFGKKEVDVNKSLRDTLHANLQDGLRFEHAYLYEAGRLKRLGQVLLSEPELLFQALKMPSERMAEGIEINYAELVQRALDEASKP